jgi:hypothetical protein
MLDRLRLVDRLIGTVMVLWLQVVGVITGTVVHHVLHSLPILLLVALPRSRWIRLTSVLASFAWIFMLAVVSDNLMFSFRLALKGHLGIELWLAPVMALLSAGWLSVNLTLLRERENLFIPCTLVSIALIPVLTALNPLLMHFLSLPVQRVLEGKYIFMFVLLAELSAILVIPWQIATRFAGTPELRVTPGIALRQALYWFFFLTCMVTGLLPVLN